MVFVFGTICIDRVRRLEALPAPGGYAEIGEEQLLLGGEASNTAVALGRWGVPYLLSGNPLGEGIEGDLLRSLVLERELRYLEPPLVDGQTPTETPVCDIYVTPDGERTMIGKGFRDAGVSLDVARLPYRSGDWFTAEPNMELASRAAVRSAVAAGMKPYLMDFIRDDEPIEPGSFWQCSTDWVGHRGNTQRNVAWVREFVAKHGAVTILSDGPNGFVAGGPELPVRAYPPFPAPSVVDTTGAGDTFRAGMLYGLSQGFPLADCFRFASAAGCLSCQYVGANTQTPTEAEIQAHIADNPDVARAYGA